MKTSKIAKPLLFLLLIATLTLASCSFSFGDKPVDADTLWAGATYKEDTELGTGATLFYLEVRADDKSVTFTIRTDETTVGAALIALDLVQGETSAYGLYVKTVNGMTADYDADTSWWGFYQNGEMLMTGVDSTAIEPGAHYELVRNVG
ncbi:MAG: DUF4430 domain-containing protein [Clostridia bacterium]|nr:DUF4430 domain-containing protein [Clostridia bacterium]